LRDHATNARELAENRALAPWPAKLLSSEACGFAGTLRAGGVARLERVSRPSL